MNGRRAAGVRQVVVGGAALALIACGAPTAAVAPETPSAASGRPAVERTLMAHDIALQPADLSVPAGVDIVIAFDNTDPGVPHGLVLYGDLAGTVALGTAPIIVGPDRQALRFPGLAPGRYRFSCVVHPMMEADLVVEPG